MDEQFLACLRCPIDPERQATLTREQQSLVCSGCGTRFPIKNGIPILVPDEAELPGGIKSLAQLPCVREASRRPK
jgi:uncharacterized protein YbaR (Trm112 family)